MRGVGRGGNGERVGWELLRWEGDLGDSYGLWGSQELPQGGGEPGRRGSSICTKQTRLMNDFAGRGRGTGGCFAPSAFHFYFYFCRGGGREREWGFLHLMTWRFFPLRAGRESSLCLHVCSSNALPSEAAESASPANSETCISSEKGRLGEGSAMRT